MMTADAVNWHDALRVAENLSRAEQLQLITELLQRMQADVADEEPVDLLTLAGVGAEVWSNIDVDAYLQQEREGW